MFFPAKESDQREFKNLEKDLAFLTVGIKK
jgi:hypothetical protein